MRKILVILLFLFIALPASAALKFDPNYIISDQEMLDSKSMSLAEIEAFLKAKNGYISKNRFPNANGEYKTAAEIIYEAANNYDCDGTAIAASASRDQKAKFCRPVTINPKLLIVLLQKEQSLIEETNPRQSQLDWATGYGCPDGQACNTRWQGFGKQVNSAALQFFDYMHSPTNYPYLAGRSYTVTNTGRAPMRITPANQATASLYNYTPHVYWGNFNFFKLWNRYFTLSYPNNTLLQAKGEPGVWLLKDGKIRPFLSKGALTSRYDAGKIVQVDKSVLNSYVIGDPIKFPQYSLIRSPRGTIFLLVDDQRRGFADGEAFRKIGYNPEEIINASWDDINAYEEGKPITSTSSYPTGALLQDISTGGIYFVTEGTKAPLWDRSLLSNKFKWKSITPETPEKLASYKTVEPAIFNDGELLKSDSSPAVYVVDNGKKRAITSGAVFEELGYSWKNIITVPVKILDLYPDGEPLAKLFNEDEIEIIDEYATSSPEVASTSPELPEIEETVVPEAPKTTIKDDVISPELRAEIDAMMNP